MLTAGPESGTFEQHHQRDLVAQRQLGEPVSLGVAAWADAARQRGEVFRADHHRRTIDKTRAGDDAVGRDLAADERPELAERAGIEESLESCAGIELALAAMLGEPLRSAHRHRALTPKIEIFERLLPVLLVRHPPFLSSYRDRRTGMFTLTILNRLL